MVDKIASLFHSRRFWIALGGVVFTLFDGLGLGVTHDLKKTVPRVIS